MLHGKKIILGVCGSIAAYKSAILVRLLVKEGAEVQVVMTASASTFITPLTLSTLSKREVFAEFTNHAATQWNNHVSLGLWADYMMIAPASAHTIAKMANGICDNFLLSVYLSARCPVAVAPAMDLDMLQHPSTVENFKKLQSYNNTILPSPAGALASGLQGHGRMAEPEYIVEYLSNTFKKETKLQHKKILITAGPTQEALDPVRFIGNHSTGKMGYALAAQAIRMGAQVTLISGPVQQTEPYGLHELVRVTTAEQMHLATSSRFADADIIIYAAAVADYKPKNFSDTKIKKNGVGLNLELVKTVDIAAETARLRRAGQLLIGFALETDHELQHAIEKVKAKNLDWIVLNSVNDPGAGFGHDTNQVTIVNKDGSYQKFELKTKQEVAADILNILTKHINVNT